MKKTLIVVVILISSNLFAQSGPQELIDTFFATYEKNAGKAVKELYATNKWNERIKDKIDNIVGTVNGFIRSSTISSFKNKGLFSLSLLVVGR